MRASVGLAVLVLATLASNACSKEAGLGSATLTGSDGFVATNAFVDSSDIATLTITGGSGLGSCSATTNGVREDQGYISILLTPAQLATPMATYEIVIGSTDPRSVQLDAVSLPSSDPSQGIPNISQQLTHGTLTIGQDGKGVVSGSFSASFGKAGTLSGKFVAPVCGSSGSEGGADGGDSGGGGTAGSGGKDASGDAITCIFETQDCCTFESMPSTSTADFCDTVLNMTSASCPSSNPCCTFGIKARCGSSSMVGRGNFGYCIYEAPSEAIPGLETMCRDAKGTWNPT